MRSVESVMQGIRAIFENKLRSSLTLLGIMIGIAAVLAMVSISDGARQIVMSDIERIGGNNQFSIFKDRWSRRGGRFRRNTSPEYMVYDDVLAIERECPSVIAVIPRVPQFRGVSISTGKGMEARETRAGYQGTTKALMESWAWYPEDGRFVEESDEIDWNRAATIGVDVADQLFPEEDPVGMQVKIGGERFTVVGVMTSRGTSIQYGWNLDNMVFIPLSTAQVRFRGNDEVPMVSVQAVSTDKIPKAMAEVEAVLKRRHNGDTFFRMWAPGTENLEFVTTVSTLLRVVLGTIAGFSLFIGGVGIMNIMLVSVTERTREIGLRKALGGRRRDILIQFLIEAATLCLVGGFLGIAVGVGFGVGSAKVISNPVIGGFIGGLLGVRGDWGAWPGSISIPWILISIVVSLAVGLVFGLFPAWKAARLTPIDALRHQ